MDDEEFARRLQAEFDEEDRKAAIQEDEDAAFAQSLASQSHDLSDSDDDEVTFLQSPKKEPPVVIRCDDDDDEDDDYDVVMEKKVENYHQKEHTMSDDEDKEEHSSPKRTASDGKNKDVCSNAIAEVSQKGLSQGNSEHAVSDVDDDEQKHNSPKPKVNQVVKIYTVSDITSKKSDITKKRPLCKFGAQCYRKNPWHLDEFYHPHLEGNSSNGESASAEPSPSEHQAKRQKSVSDNKTHINASNLIKKPFAIRLAASAPFNLFLNKTFSVKETHSDPLALVFPDILSPDLGEIVESAQLNFMVDLKYLMDNYRACQADKKPLLVMYGQLEGDPKDYERVTCTKVDIPFRYGTHHTKMMLLQYKTGLRVVIHTANLVPDDWEEKTQGYWVSPLFPELNDNKASVVDGESPTRFKRDLVEYLLSYKAPDLTRWSHTIRKYDFSSCNVVFVGSTPGYHTGEHKDKWGHMKVRRIMCQHASSWKSSMPILAQCSSIGSLGKDARSWLSGELGVSLTGGASTPPTMKVIFPSEDDIRNSSQGWLGGSCLPYQSSVHAKQEWMIQHFHLWRCQKRRRTRAMPHIKTYTRFDKDWSKAQFLLITSANLSKAAWGMLQKQDSQLFIRSYEAGVLFLPKFVTGTGDFELKSPWTELGFSLPYDVPPTPYPSNAKPWLMDTNKTECDVFGHTYP